MKEVLVVIVTKNSFRDKDGSIETVLAALDGQFSCNFGVALVDNGSIQSDQEQLRSLAQKFSNLDLHLQFENFPGVAQARNRGARAFASELILFMDDDSVLLKQNSIDRILEVSKKHDYGYGAPRLWTDRNWYRLHKDAVNKSASAGDFTQLIAASGEPDPAIRRKSSNRYLNRSFIGNFGFVKREAFLTIHGWPEYFNGYGCEDDAMSFLLYKEFGRPYIFTDPAVAHITHEINELSFESYEANLNKYREFLEKHGAKKFHIGDLLYDCSARDIIE